MREVTVENFSDLYPEIEKSLQNARFIAIDTEFSSLNPTTASYNSLFDSASDRYKKLKRTVESIIPVQIGVTAFSFDADSNSYHGDVYAFYIFPRSTLVNKRFVCEASSLQFLARHQFDFNKFVCSGVSYLSNRDERSVRSRIDGIVSEIASSVEKDIEDATFVKDKAEIKVLSRGRLLDLNSIYKKYKFHPETIYLLHKNIRNCGLWSYIEDDQFCIKQVSNEEFKRLVQTENLEEQLLDSLLGFTKVYQLIIKLKKPIIGHNILTDLALLVNSFDGPLPHSYTKFKSLLHNLFPVVYDTKILSYELRNSVPEAKRWKQNLLEMLYTYFKDGDGRHLALNSPYIKMISKNTPDDYFHNARFDSYCTGYIFIRMAHVFVSEGCNNKKKVFMSTELLNAVARYKNCLNIIRGAIAYVQLDGKDPTSTRPPWLVVESVQNKPVDLNQVSAILNNYGSVEVKPLSKGRRALVAVDNFGSARRILSQFKARKDFRIMQYSVLQHSPVARAAMWSGVVASGLLFIWLVHDALSK